jgi:hypothetical protein
MQFLSADLLCKSGEKQKREGAMADEKEEQRKRKYEKGKTPNGRVTDRRRRNIILRLWLFQAWPWRERG